MQLSLKHILYRVIQDSGCEKSITTNRCDDDTHAAATLRMWSVVFTWSYSQLCVSTFVWKVTLFNPVELYRCFVGTGSILLISLLLLHINVDTDKWRQYDSAKVWENFRNTRLFIPDYNDFSNHRLLNLISNNLYVNYIGLCQQLKKEVHLQKCLIISGTFFVIEMCATGSYKNERMQYWKILIYNSS